MLSNAKFSTAILDLLYLNKQVVLPGIGTFYLIPQIANINAIDGYLTPPSNDLLFRDSYDAGNFDLSTFLAKNISSV